MASIPRSAYADMFGPTVGDRVRLADTGLIVEVEKAFPLAAAATAKKSSLAAARPSATAWRRPSARAPKVRSTRC